MTCLEYTYMVTWKLQFLISKKKKNYIMQTCTCTPKYNNYIILFFGQQFVHDKKCDIWTVGVHL